MRSTDSRRLGAAVVLVLAVGACYAPTDGEIAPVIDDFEQVVPASGLPPEVVPQEANNNLDVTVHQGRTFLAFRTAPSHFASPDVVMYVVSSVDGTQWDHEATITLGTDVREPNFFEWDGELWLYFAVLGDNALAFDPQGSRRIQRTGPGSWTEPEVVLEPTFIPWRIKEERGVVYLIGYTDGGSVYDPDGVPIEISWRTTADGVTWDPVVPGQPVVLTGGSSETDLVMLDDGSLVAVVRNEAGDEEGFGSKICRAEADALGDWACVADRRKYDSPLLFREGGDLWLVGRRNLTDTGDYDLGRDDLDPEEQYLTYQWDYWHERKRCSLWRVDAELLSVSFVRDLPSRGDTCFPEVISRGEGVYELYNYSSDPEGPDYVWIDGQTNPTNLYRMTLTFP